MIAMKFGGTSVGSVEAFTQVAQIVARRVEEQAQTERPGVVVITSAMSGVTDILINSATEAAKGNEEPAQEALNTLLVKHQMIAGQFIEDGAQRAELGHILDERLSQFHRLCTSIAVLGELTDRGLDVVCGLGERMSTPLLAAVLRGQGIKAEFVDAGSLIVTDNVHGGAAPRMALTVQQCRDRLLPMLEEGIVPIITGFVGATEDGMATTLGRGGSDYSAAIIGAALDVDEIQIWTDVDGILTADPRVVSDARSLNQLTYEEVGELAYFGAKVLHPKTVTPAVEKGIALRVLNTFNPEHPGTRIVERKKSDVGGTVKAITSIKKMNLITVAGRGMLGVPGIAARTFNSVAQVGANVLMISQSSSEQSICFVVPESSAQTVLNALQEEFSKELERDYIEDISGQSGIVIVAVVGSAMRGAVGIAANVFQAVAEAEINVIAISQGSSEANISFVVGEKDATEVVRAIHRVFELEKPTEERMK